MKRLLPTLLLALVAAQAPAQVITTLKSYRFDDKPVMPPDHLVRAEDGTLYGMSDYALYRWQPDGSGFAILKQMSISSGDYFIGRPALSGNTLYGATISGKVFKMNTDGTGYTELAGFPNWDGLQDWYMEFEFSGDKIFGSTSRDGQYGAGTVFTASASHPLFPSDAPAQILWP